SSHTVPVRFWAERITVRRAREASPSSASSIATWAVRTRFADAPDSTAASVGLCEERLVPGSPLVTPGYPAGTGATCRRDVALRAAWLGTTRSSHSRDWADREVDGPARPGAAGLGSLRGWRSVATQNGTARVIPAIHSRIASHPYGPK